MISRKILLIINAGFFSVSTISSANTLLPSGIQAVKYFSTAPQYPETPLPAEPISKQLEARSSEFTRTGNFGTLDLSIRDIASAFYLSIYSSSENTAIEWTGDLSDCNAGDTANIFKDAILTRINWYRAMAGIERWLVSQTILPFSPALVLIVKKLRRQPL